MFSLPLLVAALLSQTAPPVIDRQSAVAELSALDPSRVAAVLLPTDAAATIVHHQVSMPDPMAPPPPPGEMPRVAYVALFSEARPVSEGVCQRQAYGVDVRRTPDRAGFLPAARPGRARLQIRFDPDCARARDRRFADLNGADIAESAAMLRRLAALQSAARRGEALDVLVDCVSEIQSRPCPSDDRRLVTTLPLDGAFLFGRTYDEPRRLTLAMTDSQPGEAYWEAVFIDGVRPRLRLTYELPAPF